MKPMKVEAGQLAPDVDELLEKASKLMQKAESKESKEFGSTNADGFERVNGVEKVRPGYYWTNQQKIKVEDVKRQKPKAEKANLKTHSGYPNVVEMRENKAGDPSDKNPEGAYNLTEFY